MTFNATVIAQSNNNTLRVSGKGLSIDNVRLFKLGSVVNIIQNGDF